MKLLLDTNVWIAFFRNPSRWDQFENRMQHPLLLMSSIVALELRAGCVTSREKKDLASFLTPFEKAGRLITPDYASFLEAGRVLAEFKRDGIGAAHCRQILNDVLIAVTAVRAGAVVVTANGSDFLRIEKHTAVRWMQPN